MEASLGLAFTIAALVAVRPTASAAASALPCYRRRVASICPRAPRESAPPDTLINTVTIRITLVLFALKCHGPHFDVAFFVDAESYTSDPRARRKISLTDITIFPNCSRLRYNRNVARVVLGSGQDHLAPLS